jgi:hypothetical protein
MLILVGSLIAVPALAQDVPECRTAGYLQRFGYPVATVGSCEEVAHDTLRWNGHSARIRLIRLRGSGSGDGGADSTGLHEAAVAASQAMTRLGGDVDIDNVTILLGDAISPAMGPRERRREPGSIGAYTLPPAVGECPVYYFKTLAGRSRDAAIDQMVHEVFHCIQYKRWGGIMRGGNWLIEGSAEYFTYLARPTRAFRAPDDIADFDGAIASQPIDAMTYQSLPFFLWLGDTGGPAQVFQFIGRPQPIATMIAFDRWQAFGRAYFDGRIHMPDGGRMPAHPRVPSSTVTASVRLRFGPAPAYTLAARDLVFAQPKSYHFAAPPLASNFFFLWRKQSDADWGSPPTDIETGCSDKNYRAIWGGTGGTEEVDATVTSRSGATGTCSCPAGIWQETPESTRSYFEQNAMGPYGGGTRKRFVSGTRTLTLNPDHTGSFSYDSIEVMTGEGSEMVLDQVQTGTSAFTWKVVGGMVLTVLQPGNNLLNLNNTITTPGRVLHENRVAGLQSIGHLYTCDSSGLHLRIDRSRLPPGFHSAFIPDMDFQRIGGER